MVTQGAQVRPFPRFACWALSRVMLDRSAAAGDEQDTHERYGHSFGVHAGHSSLPEFTGLPVGGSSVVKIPLRDRLVALTRIFCQEISSERWFIEYHGHPYCFER